MARADKPAGEGVQAGEADDTQSQAAPSEATPSEAPQGPSAAAPQADAPLDREVVVAQVNEVAPALDPADVPGRVHQPDTFVARIRPTG